MQTARSDVCEILAATVLIFNFLIPVKLIGIKTFFPLEHVINRTSKFLRNYAHGEFCELLFIKWKRTESDVKTGAIKNVYVREDYGAIIKEADISNLENILSSSKVYVAFLGKKNTKKMELKAKYIKAMQATIEKWKSINEKIEE